MEIQSKKDEEERVKKQNALKGTVQGMLKTKIAATTKEKPEKFKNDDKAMKAIQDAIKKGRSRPMLLEQSASDYKASSNLAFLKAT